MATTASCVHGTSEGLLRLIEQIVAKFKPHYLSTTDRDQIFEWANDAEDAIKSGLDTISRPDLASTKGECYYSRREYEELEAALVALRNATGPMGHYKTPCELPVIDSFNGRESLANRAQQAKKAGHDLPSQKYHPIMVYLELNVLGIDLFCHSLGHRNQMNARVAGYTMQKYAEWSETSHWTSFVTYLEASLAFALDQGKLLTQCDILNDVQHLMAKRATENWRVEEVWATLYQQFMLAEKHEGRPQVEEFAHLVEAFVEAESRGVPFPPPPSDHATAASLALPPGLTYLSQDTTRRSGVHHTLNNSFMNRAKRRSGSHQQQSFAHRSFETLSPRKRSFYFNV